MVGSVGSRSDPRRAKLPMTGYTRLGMALGLIPTGQPAAGAS